MRTLTDLMDPASSLRNDDRQAQRFTLLHTQVATVTERNGDSVANRDFVSGSGKRTVIPAVNNSSNSPKVLLHLLRCEDCVPLRASGSVEFSEMQTR